MLRVDQQAIVHNVNFDLIGIRNTEISYFNNFFTNFGTQCALIAGFLAASISQVPALDATCHLFFVYLYFFSTAIAFVAAMQVLICTVYISVYGQGLALRGPVGSMIKAVNGMVEEQKQILISFIVTIVFFSLSTIGTFFIMMNFEGAVVSSVVALVGLGFWYHYVVRIFNRFKWKKRLETVWGQHEDQMATMTPQKISRSVNATSDVVANPSPKKKDKSSKWWKAFLLSRSKIEEKDLKEALLPTSMPPMDTSLCFGGYITMEISSPGFFKDTWQRRYIVVENNLIYYYQNQEMFQKHPDQMIRPRPSNLEGYSLHMESVEPPFIIYLIPLSQEDDRKIIQFLCDTKHETEVWLEIFVKAIAHNATPKVSL